MIHRRRYSPFSTARGTSPDDLTDEQLEQKARSKYPGIDIGTALTNLPPGFVLDSSVAAKAERPHVSTDPAGLSLHVYKVTAPDGRTFRIEGAAPPTEQVLEKIVAKMDEAERQEAKMRSRLSYRLGGWFRAWLALGLLPPAVAFALLESLIWAVRGFSTNEP